MADFQESRDRLREASGERASAAAALQKAQQQLKQLAAAEKELDRTFDPRNRQHLRDQKRLRERQAEAKKKLDGAASDLREKAALAQELAGLFASFSDPRKGIAQLKDDFPILLFPVRLETRFKDLDGRRQLWVRIYPDECSIDTFEPTLSTAEIKNARRYWTGIWQAGGSEDAQRGAWRGLVAGHGSGRAAWIVETYQPLTAGPTKLAPTDIFLTVPTETPLAGAEETATAEFWSALWRADGGSAASAAALAIFEGAVGQARAAEISAQYRPDNFDERPQPPLTKSAIRVSTVFVVFPPTDEVASKQQSWTRAPQVVALPDRFVFLGYTSDADPLVVLGNPVTSPLIAGPDPSADPAEQLQQKDGGMLVPEEMKWMTDFERAVAAGMGLRIDLDAATAGGFRRVLVVGLRLSANEAEGKAELETLLQNHQRGRSGFQLVPQGAPTNNTESGGSSFTRSDDADGSYDDQFKKTALFETSADALSKSDGQCLAEALGIDGAVLAKTRHSGGTDQREARAMNTALWPGTFGYWMETMMQPVFEDETVAHTRDFFTGYVSGRGGIPAVRIGKQPYGILPATAFSRSTWMNRRGNSGTVLRPNPFFRFLEELNKILRVVGADWKAMAAEVPAVGRAGDPHATLLKIVGLHSGSVSYAQRFAEDSEHGVKLASFSGLQPKVAVPQAAVNLLKRFGYFGAVPDVMRKAFYKEQPKLTGPVIDDRPLSETEAIRAYRPDGKNYLEWLIDAARTSLDAVRMESGFNDGKPPTALLYLLLRYAIEQGFQSTSIRLFQESALLTTAQARLAKSEPAFIHVKAEAALSESRYELLYRKEPTITGSATLPVGEFISKHMPLLGVASDLPGQLRALEALKRIPTARLERVFAEHIDCCRYRYDAWLLGFARVQLEMMRNVRDGSAGEPRTGIYLGAYAWLEEVRPEKKKLTPVRELDPELDKIFNTDGQPPLERDSANQGYIHAPSLNQAVTAAVLRNGFISNASAQNRQTLAVNLTSERVRAALGILEGIRNGQSLGALLGYQFERGLHDRHGLVEVDKFIFDIRKEFPLRANRLKSTAVTDDAVAIEAIEARNVMDGLRLVERVKTPANKLYPFGFTKLPPASALEQTAINAEVERLLDTHDAVADLALAEGVHQAVQGNYERAAGTLDAYSKGNFPPEPEVVRTPTNGTGLTHRVALHLESGLAAAATATPRVQAEPALDRWLASVLPPLGQIGCKIVFRAAATNAETSREVTLGDLGLSALDLIYIFRDASGQAMSELDDRIVQHAIATHAPRPDGGVSIRYMEKIAAPLRIFEVMPLIRALRPLALSSRPLRASDLALTNEAGQDQDEAAVVDVNRILAARLALQNARAQLALFETAVFPDVDARLEAVVAALREAAGFGVLQAGWGFAYDWRQRQFIVLLKKFAALAERWTARLAEYEAALVAVPPAAPDAEKFALLQSAESLISATATQPLPATIAAYEAILAGKKAAFTPKLTALDDLQNTTATTFTALLADAQARLPISDFDLVEFSLADEEKQPALFTADADTAVRAVLAEIDRRLASAQIQIDLHTAAAAPTARVKALQAAAKALFGEEFVVVPEFRLRDAVADEAANAIAASAQLLQHLTAPPLAEDAVDFPVDEWLYGLARVREKMRAWEQVVMLTGAFGLPEPELQPAQFPFQPADDWLALRIPAAYPLDRDRLLYTAHHTTAFAPGAPLCGLLLDEWSEVIPGPDAMTGLTFHHDRPNSEPPQTMLLVLPTDFRGAWQWADLVDALNETLDLAALRAVEPDHLAAREYGALLPAPIMAATTHGLTISANLARNNGIKTALKP